MAVTDPAVGGGGDLRVASRFFARPDARALIVFGDGDSYTIGLMRFGVGVTF